MSRQPYAGVYENLNFPPYKFQEYPKHVGLKDIGGGKSIPIVADSQKHELELLAMGDIKVKTEAAADAATEVLKSENEMLKAKMAELEAKMEALLAPKALTTPKVNEALATLTKK